MRRVHSTGSSRIVRSRHRAPWLLAALVLAGCGQAGCGQVGWEQEAPAQPDAPRPSSASSPASSAEVSLTPAAPAASVSTGSSPSAPPGGQAPAPPVAATPADAPPRVIDLHVDTPWQVHFKGRDIELVEGHATMKALQEGRYAAVTYPIYIADHLHDGHPTIADADAILKTIDALLRRHDDVLWDPRVGGAAPADKVTALISIEGAGAFADDIPQIDRFIARGVRFVGPVHATDNRLASSATGKRPGYGLTDAGKALCRRVYAAGALVDVSHMSDAAFADLEALASEAGAPIVATHSNARAVADHPRNLTDDQLRAIARSGGVAGLNLHSGFLRRGGETPSLADAVKQVKHMVAIAGIEHVAIGSDFDGASPPADLGDASRMPALGDALEREGLPRADVRAIFEGNARRILAWRPRGR